ncbi:Phosphatidylinositol_transfer protein [Hexamita inflata]|uniref:Phosphatidylinositol transfer protein n=1 Tax=Hexamita inflata TaxID=28002 RepID=A0AA86TUP3_9EUKA|nr:Phosphatidylinositol transfer protein [Hexamita inflata]CAI9947395.1 Phosphatidylinositol transfer protein [Hexamita inflata]
MKYYLYAFKLPFSCARFKVANAYMVGQSEKTANQGSKTVEVVSQDLIKSESNGETNIEITSKKIIHIDRAVPKGLKGMVPKYAYSIHEDSHTLWPCIDTIYSCPADPKKLTCEVRTITKDSGSLNELPEEFSCYVADKKKLTITSYDFQAELKALGQQEGLNVEYSYSYKLLVIDANIFGQSIIEKIAGSKMRTIFLNNYKNLILDYPNWKQFQTSDIERLRNGEGVKLQEVLEKDEEDVEEK